MIGKDSAKVRTSWISIFEELEDAEAGQLIKHFMRYINDLNPEEPSRLIKLVFAPIKCQLKKDLVAWKLRCEQNKFNGKMGGRLKADNSPPKITVADKFIDTLEEDWKPIVRRWLDFKRGRSENYRNSDSLGVMFDRLKKFSDNNLIQASEIIESSIGNNYSGLFKPKGNANSGYNKKNAGGIGNGKSESDKDYSAT